MVPLENGVWRVAFYPTTPVAHRTVLGYNSLRVSGEIDLRFNTIAGMAGIAIFDHAGLRILVDPEDNAANGNLFNSPGQFQINSRDEVAVLNNAFSSQVIGVLRNGAMRHVDSADRGHARRGCSLPHTGHDPHERRPPLYPRHNA